MKIRATLAALAVIFVASFLSAEIGIGDPRDEVLRQIGKPTSFAKRGSHEIFLYPKGGRIEFVDGKVADVKGPLPTPVATTPAVPASEGPAPQAAEKTSPSSAPGPATKATAPKAYNPAVAAEELAKHVEKMDTPWGAAPGVEKTHASVDPTAAFLTGLLLRFGITILALKLAFKYWEMDAFWRGIFAIAGIDLVVHALFRWLGPATGGFTTLSPVENGIPGLVLIYTIHTFCFNKRIQNAVLTAVAVKVVVTLCYVFASVAVADLIHG